MIIAGKKVTLRPMTLEEVPAFYKWAIKSPFWYGEYSDEPIPTYQKFREDWQDYYFDRSQPERGRAFSIVVDNQAIGEINYEINKEKRTAELDILIFEEKDRDRGYGSDAERTLAEWLFKVMNVKKVIIDHNIINKAAIQASQKAGFQQTKTYTENKIEWVHLEKQHE